MTLRFERAGEVEVQFEVQEMGARHPGTEPRRAQVFLSAIPSTTFATSSQRSVIDSSRS